MNFNQAKLHLSKGNRLARLAWNPHWSGPFIYQASLLDGRTGLVYCARGGRGTTAAIMREWKPSPAEEKAKDWVVIE